MKKWLLPLLVFSIFFAACNSNVQQSAAANKDSSAITDPSTDWKFGVALWTFHTFNFADALDKIDSAGLVYIEPNTFQKGGPDVKGA